MDEERTDPQARNSGHRTDQTILCGVIASEADSDTTEKYLNGVMSTNARWEEAWTRPIRTWSNGDRLTGMWRDDNKTARRYIQRRP